MKPATHLDLYQLTSLVPHWDAGMATTPVTMSFFARRLPRTVDGAPSRGYLLWVGLRRCLEWLADARFEEGRITTLLEHPMLGPALRTRPKLVDALRAWRFRGLIDAPPEGTPLWAGRATDQDGQPIDVHGVRPSAQTPFLVVRTDLLTAKLIETPLLSIINHMTMVASKAARVVDAAGVRAILEFGSRRTHPQAAVDGAYAAYIAGCAGTSNVEAHHRYGIPVLGTMDHFAIQAWERDGIPRHDTEAEFFKAFHAAFPDASILLVDTYDAYGPKTGIPAAVRATNGRLGGIRLDSLITPDNVRRARALLDDLGAAHARIVVSGGMDETAITALRDAPVDAFGVGERIVTSPDSPVGVGAVGKLCEVDGRPTMKMSRGSGKATLPGRVQVFRHEGVDTVARHHEILPGTPLLQPVWTENGPVALPEAAVVRAYARSAIQRLPESCRVARQVDVPISPALATLIQHMVESN
ncbi:MAG: nicotinate phosphoribosyltransferase [Myxococcota bacterium]|nr:nicotinate phosphoribosyltransferase [Myxococcota bacterium]